MFFAHAHLIAHGTSPCLLYRGQTLSYADLAGMAAGIARRLPRQRALIAVEMRADPQAIAGYLAALQAGHAVLPLPADDPETGRSLERRFRPAASWRLCAGRWRLIAQERPAALHPDLGLVLVTSGSTGQGKGVRLSVAALHANAAAIAEFLQIGGADRAALILPLHYSYGLSVLHSHLLQGASLWLAEGSVLSAGFAQALQGAGATSLAGVPHHMAMLETAGIDHALPGRLRCITVAGGALKPAAVRHWAGVMARAGGRFVVMYGQTEATARMAWLPPDRVADAPEAIGLPIPGGRFSLRDPQGRTLEGPAEGELIYHGPNVMMGYADGAADLALGPGPRDLATGDLARRGADGLYRITGRLSRMSKIGGLRIGHDALERGLAEAGHETAVWGDDSAIWIAAPGGDPVALADQAARLCGIGAQHFSVLPCAALPRRANGKVDYPALKAREQRGAGAGVLAAFARCFAPQPVGPGDSFTTLGGDSLQHVELALVLDRQLGSLPPGWEDRPVADLQAMAAPGQRMTRLPLAVLARVIAILAVVLEHQTHWPTYGGAAAMVILLGLSVARHRRQALVAGDALAFLRPLLRVLLPYGVVLAGFAIAWGQVPWASVFLIGNFGLTRPETHLMLPYLYWFVEAYAQMTLLVLALFCPPPARRWLGRQPFAAGLALLALAFALRLVQPEFLPLPGGRSQFAVPWVFYLFALGWCIAMAETRGQRRLVMGLACVILPVAALLGGNWYGGWIKYMGLLGLVALLLRVDTVALPKPVARVALHVAQAAFWIYLLHRLVPEALLPALGVSTRGPMMDLVSILGGLGLGLLAAALQARVWPRLLRGLQTGRSWTTAPSSK